MYVFMYLLFESYLEMGMTGGDGEEGGMEMRRRKRKKKRWG
jgi:hypothetical protein